MKSHRCQWQSRGRFMLFPGGGLCCQTSVLSVFQTPARDTPVNANKNVKEGKIKVRNFIIFKRIKPRMPSLISLLSSFWKGFFYPWIKVIFSVTKPGSGLHLKFLTVRQSLLTVCWHKWKNERWDGNNSLLIRLSLTCDLNVCFLHEIQDCLHSFTHTQTPPKKTKNKNTERDCVDCIAFRMPMRQVRPNLSCNCF